MMRSWTGSLVELHSEKFFPKRREVIQDKIRSKLTEHLNIFEFDSDEGMISDLCESPSEDSAEINVYPEEGDNKFHRLLNNLLEQEKLNGIHLTDDENNPTPVNCTSERMKPRKNAGRHSRLTTNTVFMPDSLPASLECPTRNSASTFFNDIFQKILQSGPDDKLSCRGLQENIENDLINAQEPDNTENQFLPCHVVSSDSFSDATLDVCDGGVCMAKESLKNTVTIALETSPNDDNSSGFLDTSLTEPNSPSTFTGVSLEFEDSGCSSFSCDIGKTILRSANKKNVRFADEEGQQLVEHRTIDPRNTRTEYLEPDMDILNPSSGFIAPFCLPHRHSQNNTSPPNIHRLDLLKKCTCSPWQTKFCQPAAQYMYFRNRVETKNVALENIHVDSDHSLYLRLKGTIKVKNMNFEKQVWLRMTMNNWRSYIDYPAEYNKPLSECDFRFDTFTFDVKLARDLIENEIQIAIGYRSGKSQEFWDNNDGENFIIEQFASSKHHPYCKAKLLNQEHNNALRPSMDLRFKSIEMNLAMNENAGFMMTSWGGFNAQVPFF